MLYRVLLFALLCASPAAASIAVVPPVPVTSVPVPATSPLAVRLYGFRATGEAAPHPMSAADGHWMWDALGGGCIDGGGWDDPFPGEEGDARSPAFCVPQPCVRAMPPDELARDVFGRELERGEYRVYLQRLEEACGEIPVSPVNVENAVGIEDLLGLAPFDLVMSTSDYDWYEPETFVPTAYAATGGTVEWLYPDNWGRQQASIVPPRPSTGGTGGGGHFPGTRESSSTLDGKTGNDQSGKAGPGNENDGRVSKDHLPEPPGFPELPGDRFDPDVPGTPDQPGPGPTPQPATVPLPGGLPFLLTGIAALALRRRR